MKIPKYVQNIINKRCKLASDLQDVIWELDEWMENKGIDIDDPNISHSTRCGVEIYVNPYQAKKTVEEAIINHKK